MMVFKRLPIVRKGRMETMSLNKFKELWNVYIDNYPMIGLKASKARNMSISGSISNFT